MERRSPGIGIMKPNNRAAYEFAKRALNRNNVKNIVPNYQKRISNLNKIKVYNPSLALLLFTSLLRNMRSSKTGKYNWIKNKNNNTRRKNGN